MDNRDELREASTEARLFAATRFLDNRFSIIISIHF
jgi:hypothetical protein